MKGNQVFETLVTSMEKMHKSRWPYMEKKKKQQHKVVALSPNQQCTNNKQTQNIRNFNHQKKKQNYKKKT